MVAALDNNLLCMAVAVWVEVMDNLLNSAAAVMDNNLVMVADSKADSVAVWVVAMVADTAVEWAAVTSAVIMAVIWVVDSVVVTTEECLQCSAAGVPLALSLAVV
tara:strand:+ start:234 stop:548 length:315 start_codon:yes stop_codon:yes gene_type:complete